MQFFICFPVMVSNQISIWDLGKTRWKHPILLTHYPLNEWEVIFFSVYTTDNHDYHTQSLSSSFTSICSLFYHNTLPFNKYYFYQIHHLTCSQLSCLFHCTKIAQKLVGQWNSLKNIYYFKRNDSLSESAELLWELDPSTVHMSKCSFISNNITITGKAITDLEMIVFLRTLVD